MVKAGMMDIASTVNGFCTERFSGLKTALAQSLRAGDGRTPQTVAVVIDGEPVAHLWGGYRDLARTAPWQKDTLVCMMSVGKAIAAITCLTLVDDGKLELDQPVARYWPEFAQGGKDAITVRQLLAHQSLVFSADAAPLASGFDWDTVIKALEVQEPLKQDGVVGSYHSFTYGYLVGELVRRITGTDVGSYLRGKLEPLFDGTYAFGLTPAEQKKCADLPYEMKSALLDGMLDREKILARCWDPLPVGTLDFNGPRLRGSVLPSLNGHGTTLWVASLFSSLASGDEKVLSRGLVKEAATPHWEGDDIMLEFPNKMGLGLMLPTEVVTFNGSASAFGHAGVTGAFSFADPDQKLGFSWAPGYFSEEGLEDPSLKRLIDTTNEALAQ